MRERKRNKRNLLEVENSERERERGEGGREGNKW